jgi:hypothetical protein
VQIKKIVILSFIILLTALSSAAQTWELKVDQEGIKVYTRKIEGSNVVQFKGEATVKSNLGGILALIDSVPEYPRWMHNCGESRRIKKLSQSSGYSYYVIDAPWPVSDRDACVFYQVKQDPATKVVTISITGVKDYLPEADGRVRIPLVNASWQLIPVSRGVTKVVYQAHSEIGGYVPAAIVNAYITDTPYYNLLHLKTIVEAPAYPKIVFGYVKEM